MPSNTAKHYLWGLVAFMAFGLVFGGVVYETRTPGSDSGIKIIEPEPISKELLTGNKSASIRLPAVAGHFYEADKAALERQVDDLLESLGF